MNKGDPQILVNSMVTYLENISDASYSLLCEAFSHVFEQLKETEETQQQNIDSLNVPAQTLRQKLQEYLRELPVVGFNSSRYDLSVIKPFLIQKFVTQKTASKQMCEETNTEEDKEELDLEQDWFDITEEQEEAEDEEREKTKKTPFKFVVKRNNQYMFIATHKLRFLDINNFLAHGFSYSKYLKVFGIEEEKGYFCYEYITGLDKLKETTLPPHSAFFSQLKSISITEDEYAYCQRVWKETHMSPLKDFLIWYNNKDVTPFIQALQAQIDMYSRLNIDLLKDGISVPDITLKYLFQTLPPDTYFSLCNEKQKEIHTLFSRQHCRLPFHHFSPLS